MIKYYLFNRRKWELLEELNGKSSDGFSIEGNLFF